MTIFDEDISEYYLTEANSSSFKVIFSKIFYFIVAMRKKNEFSIFLPSYPNLKKYF